MTAEERILAYLDGSLSESESAELLHQLSVSPEKRVVLEQHLKLTELNRLAQKPFEVPAELEEKMRRRLPVVIPSSNAAPVAIRRGAIASLLLLLRSYPTRFAIGALVVLLSGAGAYMLSNNNSGPSDTSSPIVSQNVNNTAPSPRGTSVPVESKSATTTNPTQSASEPISEPTSNTTAKASARASNPANPNTVLTNNGMSSKLLTNHSSSNSSNTIHRSTKNSKIATPIAIDQANRTDIGSISNSISNHSTSTTSIGQSNAPIAETSSISLIETTQVHSQPTASISEGEIRERYRLNPFEITHNPQRSPWTVRFSLGLGETFLNVPTGNNSYTTRTESSPFIGVNYSVSPSFAVGAVVGNSTILTVSPQTETTTINKVQNVEVHTYSTNSHEWFARLASRYSVGLGGNWGLEMSAEVGMLLASKSPMACLQILGNQSLSDAIDFQFGVLGSGVWTSPAAIQTATTDQSTTQSDVVTYRTHSHTTQTKIFSPAVTGRVGLQYRF
jgi:hypothetical protein